MTTKAQAIDEILVALGAQPSNGTVPQALDALAELLAQQELENMPTTDKAIEQLASLIHDVPSGGPTWEQYEELEIRLLAMTENFTGIVDGQLSHIGSEEEPYEFDHMRAYAFANLPNLMHAYVHVWGDCGDSAFMQTGLLDVELEIGGTETGSALFRSCTDLRRAKYNAWRIDSNAFNGCGKLTTLELPYDSEVVTLSNADVFRNTPLKTGEWPSTLPSPEDGERIEVLVPADLVDSYKADGDWQSALYSTDCIYAIE